MQLFETATTVIHILGKVALTVTSCELYSMWSMMTKESITVAVIIAWSGLLQIWWR